MLRCLISEYFWSTLRSFQGATELQSAIILFCCLFNFTDFHVLFCRWSRPKTLCTLEHFFSSTQAISIWISNSMKTTAAGSCLSPGSAFLVSTSVLWSLWLELSCKCTVRYLINNSAQKCLAHPLLDPSLFLSNPRPQSLLWRNSWTRSELADSHLGSCFS